MTSGKDLKLRRVEADVKTKDIAAVMGVPSSSVSRWENTRVLRDEVVERYLAALATFATSTDTSSAA